MLDFQAARYLMKGEVPGQEGNFHPTSPGTGMFQTADGYINIAASGDNLWKKFCEVAGDKDLARQPRFRDRAAARQEPRRADRASERPRAPKPSAYLGRGTEQGRRAVRPDQHDRQGLRRPAGQASRHREAGRAPEDRRHEGRRPADPYEPLSRSPTRCARPPTRASTPMRYCANSATTRPRSRRCASAASFDEGPPLPAPRKRSSRTAAGDGKSGAASE